MSVLDRAALDASPLADLHTIASELSIDGYRRLRRAELIDAILQRQDGAPAVDRGSDQEPEPEAQPVAEPESEPESEAEPAAAPRRRRGRRAGRGRGADREEEKSTAEGDAEVSDAPAPAPEDRPGGEPPQDAEQIVEGTVELLPNGSGFLRISPPDATEDDVYISAAQVKRCELVAGDRISGPKRHARRAERFPSLVRIDTINGQSADETADGGRFDDLPAAFPDEPLPLGSDDPTLAAIASSTPIGKGSRVTIVGPARAGKTEALRRLAETLSADQQLDVSVVLAGVRPEEISEWNAGPVKPTVASSFATSADSQGQMVEHVIDQARRIAVRGGNVVVLIDTLEGLHPPAARKALAAARNIVDGGTLTVIATAAKPFGGETTVIALDGDRARRGEFPAIDLDASGTIRAERLSR